MVYLPHWPVSNKSAIVRDNGFDSIRKILDNLNNPHRKLPPVIHIAGTNGKGSTVAFLAAIFQSAGYKTHIYTSPHLHHCNERIVIANHQIDDNYLYQILEEVRIAADGIDLSLFEALTLAAILAFSQKPADICIIETGMGGRIDSTNVIDNKILTIITAISYDHTKYLGDNIAAIAAEKAHIMRNRVPAVIAHQTRPAGATIEIRSLEIDNPLIHYGANFEIDINADDSFNFHYQGKTINTDFKKLPPPALPGQHQYLNAANAIAGIIAIKDFQTANFYINRKHVAEGLKKVKWPSRLQRINGNINKIFKNPESEIWIDGAHNSGGAYVLANWFKEKKREDLNKKINKSCYLITGFTKGKAEKQFFDQFKNIVNMICPVRVQGEPNPESAEIIKEEIIKSGIDATEQEDLTEALYFLANLNKNTPCRIVICGSLYLARDLKSAEQFFNYKYC